MSKVIAFLPLNDKVICSFNEESLDDKGQLVEGNEPELVIQFGAAYSDISNEDRIAAMKVLSAHFERKYKNKRS